jgi:hypothetical protein
MGLTTIKTYANKLLYTLGPLSTLDTQKEQGYLLKEALLYGTDGIKGGPAAWVVVGSSDGSAAGMDAVDRWTDRTKVVMGTGNHSWVVVQQPALGSAPGYLQVCIDFNSATTTTLSVVFSRAAGFTGGSISARPTATDQVVIAEAANLFFGDTASSSCGINCLKSTDGKVTRLFRSVNGTLVSTYRYYWFMEQLNHVETYWPSDCVVGVCAMSISGVAANSHIFTQQGSSHAGRMTWEGYTSYQLSYATGISGMLRPDYGGAWPAFPCGLLVDTGVNKGKIGDFFDLWAAPETMPSYEYLAGSGGDFEFVNIGGIVQPWVGTTLIVP